MSDIKFRYCTSCKKKFPYRADDHRVYCHSCLKKAADAKESK